MRLVRTGDVVANKGYGMRYLVVKFIIACDAELSQTSRDLVSAMAGEVGFEAFEDTDLGVDGYVQEELFDKRRLDNAINTFPVDNVKITYTVEDLDDVDWNEQWESEGFDPIGVGNKIVIYDAKHATCEQLAGWQGRLRIGIDTKLAFGTGNHQTTQMMIACLSDLPLVGKRVLDCGSGTGILGIVASKLGAARVVAYDIDEWSVSNSRRNARINKVGSISVMLGDASVLRHYEGTFDVVLANINRNILLADMAEWWQHMAIGATLIVSGFYEEDIPMLLQCAAGLGLIEADRHVDDKWACLELRK